MSEAPSEHRKSVAGPGRPPPRAPFAADLQLIYRGVLGFLLQSLKSWLVLGTRPHGSD